MTFYTKVQFEIVATSSSNQDLIGDISISNSSLISDTNDLFDVDMGGWTAKYHKRTIIVDNITGDLNVSGLILTDAKLNLSVTVLEEPTNSSTEWTELVKNKMVTVTVTYDNATFTKEGAFATSNIRVTKGTKPWSSLVYNLPSSGTGTGTNAGKKVNYTYYVVENPSPVASNYDPATYQVDGENVSIANGEPGDTIVIINKEKHIPKVTVEGTKVWEILSVTVPSDPTLTLKRKSSKEESLEETVNDGLNKPLQPVWSGEGNTRTFTYSDLPKYDNDGYEYTYTVTEASFKINEVTYTVTENEGVYTATPDDPSASPFVVAISVSEGRTTITNTEKKEFEFTKIWKDSIGNPDEWPANKSIEVTFNAYTDASTKRDVLPGETLTFSPTDYPNGWTMSQTEDGKKTTFKISGLDAKDVSGREYIYYVKETPVEGYQEPAYETSDGGTLLDADRATNKQQIINAPQDAVTLPSTGGPGTKLIYGMGIAFIAMAGILFFIKRRNIRSVADLSERRW